MTRPAEIQRATTPQGIEIAYESFGRASDPPLLLVMGLGTQMLGWPDGFCHELVGRGHFVVRFDNRDIGLSTHLHDAPRPDPVAAWSGNLASASYTLSDMAADTAALLDTLGFDSAHLVGASMGGMIAQTLAIERPERVRSLTSIMSSTGDAKVGQATQAAMAVLMAPPARSREEAMDRVVRATGSSARRATRSTRRRCANEPASRSTARTTRRVSAASWSRSSRPATARRGCATYACRRS